MTESPLSVADLQALSKKLAATNRSAFDRLQDVLAWSAEQVWQNEIRRDRIRRMHQQYARRRR